MSKPNLLELDLNEKDLEECVDKAIKDSPLSTKEIALHAIELAAYLHGFFREFPDIQKAMEKMQPTTVRSVNEIKKLALMINEYLRIRAATKESDAIIERVMTPTQEKKGNS